MGDIKNSLIGHNNLTEKQSRFVDTYLTNGYNGKEAVKAVYNITNPETSTATNLSTHILKKPKIRAAIEARKRDLNKEFKDQATLAFDKLMQYLDQDTINNMRLSPKTRLEAIVKVLEFAGYEPPKKMESITLNIDAQDTIRKRTAELLRKKDENVIDVEGTVIEE